MQGTGGQISAASSDIAGGNYFGKAPEGLFPVCEHHSGYADGAREVDAVSRDCLDAAVAALDRAIEDRPGKVYDDLAEAMRCLVRLRDELIADWRSDSRGNSVERCNAILSLVVGGEYPLEGGPP